MEESRTRSFFPHLISDPRYITFVSPLVSESALESTIRKVKEFKENEGPQLQQILKDYDDKNRHTNYLNEMWYDMYLRNRSSFPLNLTPQLTWKNPVEPEKLKQVRLTAMFLCV